MNHFNKTIQKIVNDHHTVAFTGIMLIFMGSVSFFQNVFEKMLGVTLNLSHGFIFMGAFNILLAIAFILMGTSTIEMSLKQHSSTDEDILESKIASLSSELEKIKKELEQIKSEQKT
jgi:hypothetical protein